MGYIGMQVKSNSGRFSYVVFIKEEIYNNKGQQYKSYPASSAIFKHMADYIYDYLQNKWTKERMPINTIEITPAEMVLFGHTKN